jgi:hypothetical protein
MDYEVFSLAATKLPLSWLGLQGFLNGTIKERGLNLVTVIPLENDWLIVVTK